MQYLVRTARSNSPQRLCRAVPVWGTLGFSRSITPFSADHVQNTYVHPRARNRQQQELLKQQQQQQEEEGHSADGYMMAHPIWSDQETHGVKIMHQKCEGAIDYLAFGSVQFLRLNFDLFSGYYFGKMNETKWLTRIVFLETVAGVPGMVAAMVRHLHSLRRMKRDHGWIHTLLEEAENERMHLLTAMNLMRPGRLFRGGVIFAQCVYVPFFSLAYLLSPYYCHRFVGYLEEEAVKTYTKCLEQLDSGGLPMWSKLDAPEIAQTYWQLGKDAKMRDVILAIRADEGHHRDVNHSFAESGTDSPNPWGPGR